MRDRALVRIPARSVHMTGVHVRIGGFRMYIGGGIIGLILLILLILFLTGNL
jgi:hypothetical protein